MSAAEDSPQGFFANEKHRIRWRFVLTGLALLAFGLALPFVLKAYYSSTYSQKTETSLKKISPSPTVRKISSLKFKKQKTGDLRTADSAFSPISSTSNDLASTVALLQSSRVPQVKQTPPKIGKIPVPTKTPDKTGNDNVNRNLEKLYMALNNDPTSRGYIVSYGTDAQIARREKQILSTLNFRKLDPSRVTFIRRKGTDEVKTEMYVVPAGAELPTPTPTVKPGTPTPTVVNPGTPTPTATSTNVNGSPTPGDSPNSNTNVNSANVPANTSAESDSDKFGFTYPSRFIKGTIYTVCLSLQPGRSSLVLCDDIGGDTPVVTGSANVQPIERPGFDAYVTATLNVINGLEIVEMPEKARLSYDRGGTGGLPEWRWKLKLSEAGENSDTVEFQFNCDAEWVSRKDAANVEKKEKYWSSDPPPKSSVGLPVLSYIITALSSLGGGLAFIFGVAPALGGQTHLRAPSDRLDPGALYPPQGEAASAMDWGSVFGAAVQKKDLEDEVHCTLYAPASARAGTSFVIQIFAHVAEQAAGLAAIAAMLDEDAKKQAAEKLRRKIKRGSMLVFKLILPELKVAETEESGYWEGEPLDVQFIVSVPADHADGKRFGKVAVYENDEKIGTITFGIEIRAQEVAEPDLTIKRMTRNETAFISYASEDRAEVYDFLRLLDGFGISYHVDIFNIAPGDRWEQKLYEFIDGDDIFLLFWSQAASRSEWVIKEAERAHAKTGSKRKNPPKIVIYHLRTPPEVDVPEWLGDIHYDRKWSAIAERARRKN